jgi:hypothetical protein
MAEKKDAGTNAGLDPEKRFKYVGFDVQPGKIKDLFKSEAEKEEWVEKVRERRKKSGSRIRDASSFEKPRVAGYEKAVLTVTSLLMVISLFLPWFSGFHEYEVEAKPVAAQETALADSTMVDSLADSTALAAGESEALSSSGSALETAAPVEEIPGSETEMAGAPAQPEKDEHGFASLTGVRKRKEIRKEYRSASALASLGFIGVVFSSGIILKVTGLFFLVYILMCLFMGIYTIYLLYGIKGDPDMRALKLKRALRYNWVALGVWVFCLIISFFGASYSFDAGSAQLVQLGDSYGIGTYLTILSYGFYISLACFIMNAVKAVEI